MDCGRSDFVVFAGCITGKTSGMESEILYRLCPSTEYSNQEKPCCFGGEH